MTDNIVIHSRKLAIYLQLKGFVLLGVQPDKKSKRKIFIFKGSNDLKKHMLKYKHDKEFHAFLQQQEGR